MPSLNWYRKDTLLIEISVKGKKQLKKIFPTSLCHYFNCIATVKLLQILKFIQIILFLTIFTQMSSLNRHDKVNRFVKNSVNGKNTSKFFLWDFSHYFICLATVNLLQFLTSISDPSVFNKFYSNSFLNRHEEVTPFMVFVVNGKKNMKIFSLGFSSLFQLHCYGQVTSISYVHFRSFCF